MSDDTCIRVAVISPIVSMNDDVIAKRKCFLSRYARSTTAIDFFVVDRGPEAIETRFDEAMAVPYILKKCIEIQRQGYSGIIIWCAGDPGVGAARELVEIPVVGPGESSLFYASLVGNRFSILVPYSDRAYLHKERVSSLGLSSRLASVRGINMGVLEIRTDTSKALLKLREEGRAARDQDGADTLVLGCLSMVGLGKDLSDLGIPVIDPAAAAICLLESLAVMGLKQSAVAYPPLGKALFPY